MEGRFSKSDRAGKLIIRAKLKPTLKMDPDGAILIFDVFFPDQFPMTVPGSSTMEQVQLHMNNSSP